MKKNLLKSNKILRVSTVALFVDAHLNSQIKMMISSGLNISVATSDEALSKPIEGIIYFSVEIPREINIFKDFFALIKLYRLFRKENFYIVHSTTPKAGLLCAIAGKLARVPTRIHTFTGQRWVTLTGFKRKVVKLSDKIIGYCTTICYADSHSQKSLLVIENIISADKIKVIGKGSIAGVDLKRFNPQNYSFFDREALKARLNIPGDATVLLFVGRVAKDKGILELVEAFNKVFVENENLYLLVVGPQELNKHELGVDFSQNSSNNILFTGYTDCPEKYMSISDFLCLPSYREGFGTVVIEAAAMGLPTIGTNICGLSDAIVDNETGILVSKESSYELSLAIKRLVADKKLVKKLGFNARERAVRYYSNDYVNQLVINDYFKYLKIDN